MQCKYCGAAISESQERCGRCQRRLAGFPSREGDAPWIRSAAAPSLQSVAAAGPRPRFRVQDGGAATRPAPPVQPPLFPAAGRVIGLEDYLPPQPQRRRNPSRRPRSLPRHEVPLQTAFDFDSARPSAHEFAAAQLQLPVASLGRRSFALLVDLSFIVAGFAAFLAVVRLLLGGWPYEPAFYASLTGCLWLLAAIFFTLHAALGRRTPGQRLTGLRLVTREGRLTEPVHRVKRVLANAVPVVSLVGALWAAVTEEHLSFADLITGTYLTAADAR